MEITEVRIKLTEKKDARLQAFCSITFDDCFVVRDLKIIQGADGPFVAMPSRKLMSHCPRCGCKNHLRASFCNQCGLHLQPKPVPRDAEGRARLYADIAHPINARCREMIQQRVIAEFENEKVRAQQPGYVSRYDEAYGDVVPPVDAGPDDDLEGPLSEPPTRTQVPKPHTRSTGPAKSKGQRFTPPGPHRPPPTTPTAERPPATAAPPSPPPSPPAPPPPKEFGAGIFDQEPPPAQDSP
jgi:stage V sporulation protein G